MPDSFEEYASHLDVVQAFVGLHARSILLISRPALRLVSSAELQALVAHEMGHEYFWDEYQHAAERLDTRVLRESFASVNQRAHVIDEGCRAEAA